MEHSTKMMSDERGDRGSGFEFHKSEILPDYQKRVIDMSAKLQIVPDIKLNHIGVENIVATNAREKYFIEFASKCGFHGINHIVARRRHPVERLLAILIISGCLILQIFLSLTFWNQYQNKATIQILDFNRELFRVKRPSFFICPYDKLDEEKFPTTFKKYNVSDTPETRSFFQFLSNVHYETAGDTPEFDAVSPDKWLPILYDLRHEFDSVLDMRNVTKQWVITERGICISMKNNVGFYATLEYWQQDNWTENTLSEHLTYDIDDDQEAITIFTLVNVTVYTSDPDDIVEYQDKKMSMNISARYSLSIVECVAGKKLETMSIKQRKCKFRSDGGLKMWPIYTIQMCMIECRCHIIRESCGCVPHFMRPTVDFPVCNATQLRCIDTIKNELFLRGDTPSRCNCHANCNDTQYVVQTLNLDIEKGPGRKLSKNTLILQFPQSVIKREKIFGFSDFITAVGGAAGLFLGASVLSFVEIFYYATLRMWIYCAKHLPRGRKNAVAESFAKN